MTQRTAETLRRYDGPALFSGGFRPMFLLAGLWATVAMALWIAIVTGWLDLPMAFDPTDWHAHEFLFGYGGAVICGFLLTAIPNWTGRLPVAGPPLAALAAVWVAGRVVVALGAGQSVIVIAVVDLAFPSSLTLIAAREVWAGGNRRNLPVVALCAVFLLGNAMFHYDAAAGHVAASRYGFRLGVGGIVMLMMLIGGRVIPSFTRNWLAKRAPGALPAAFGAYDKMTLAVSGLGLVIWVARPDSFLAAITLGLASGLHVVRLVRWVGWRVWAEPLVVVLHVAYAFLPLGLGLLAAHGAWPDQIPAVAGMHALLAGGMGVLTVAVMTRASLGHTGRALTAGWIEVVIYTAITAAALARIWQALGGAYGLLHLSATLWIIGFGCFVLAYGPVFLRPRLAAKRPNPKP